MKQEMICIADAETLDGTKGGLLLSFNLDQHDLASLFRAVESIKTSVPSTVGRVTGVTFTLPCKSKPEKPYRHDTIGAMQTADGSISTPKGKIWLKLVLSVPISGEEE